MASDEDDSCSLPRLPPEVWRSVAYYIPRLSTSRWEPWKYREVNRTFKRTIEAFYFEHYVKEIEFYVDCKTNMRAEAAENLRVARTYVYEHTAGLNDEDVVFGPITKYVDQHFSTYTVTALLDNINLHLSAFDEQGYHPYIVMSIEKGLTDMLPMDLRYPNRWCGRMFRFNWRTYLCTLFCELEVSDKSEELYNETRSCVKLAIELNRKYPNEDPEGASPQAMSRLIEAAGISSVGCDGRLKELRRSRRIYLGQRSGQLPSYTSLTHEVDYQRFVRRDEDQVAHKLMVIQNGMDDVEW